MSCGPANVPLHNKEGAVTMAKQTQLERRLAELDKLRAKGILTDEEYASRRAAIVASPEATVAVKEGGSKARGIFKWGFFGCLGMIGAITAFFVVIAVIVAAAGGGSSSNSSESGQAGTNKGDV